MLLGLIGCSRSSVRHEKTPLEEGQEYASLLAGAFQKNGLEFGWTGGSANEKGRGNYSFVKVTDVSTDANLVEIKYDWKRGVLTGKVEGKVFKGTWTQDNGKGNFEMTFANDHGEAEGWWNDSGHTGPDGIAKLRSGWRLAPAPTKP